MPRNARLDPHPDYGYYSKSCISNIESAFKSKIPAVIDFHRVNISGKYNREYRKRSLQELKKVLSHIRKYWSDAKFISTQELLNICN